MPTDSGLDKVKELLASGKTEDAADLLLTLAKDADEVNYSSALMLKNQLEQLQQDVIDGVVSDSEQRLNWAKISRRIIELTRQIERGEGPKSVTGFLPPVQKVKLGASFPKWLIWGVPVVLLIGFFGVKILYRDKPPKTTNVREKAETPAMEMVQLNGKLIYSDLKPAAGIQVAIFPIIDGMLKRAKPIKFTTQTDGSFNFSYPKKFAEIEENQIKIIFEKDGKTIYNRTEKFMPQKFQPMTIQRSQ